MPKTEKWIRLAGLLCERRLEAASLKQLWDKYQLGNVVYVRRKSQIFLTVYVDDIKMAGKKFYWIPMLVMQNNKASIWEIQHFQ